MEEELSPCPFCGSDGDEVAVYFDGHDESDRAWFVRCHVCFVETVRDISTAGAIAVWNRRPTIDAPQIIEIETTPIHIDFESTAAKYRTGIIEALHDAGAPMCHEDGQLMSAVEQINWLAAKSVAAHAQEPEKEYGYDDFFAEAISKGLTIHDILPAVKRRLAEIESAAPASTAAPVVPEGMPTTADALNQQMQFGADMSAKYVRACNVAATLADALGKVLKTYRSTQGIPQTTMQAETQLDRIREASGKGTEALAGYEEFMLRAAAPSAPAQEKKQ